MNWTEECMTKQRQGIPKCAGCGKSTGKGHYRECGACGLTKSRPAMTHEPWCSRHAS